MRCTVPGFREGKHAQSPKHHRAAHNHLVPKHGQAARKASRANSLKFSCIRAGLSSMYFTTTLTACPLVTPGGWHTSAVNAAIVSTIPRHWPRAKASAAAVDGVCAVKERQPGIMWLADSRSSAKDAPQLSNIAATPAAQTSQLIEVSMRCVWWTNFVIGADSWPMRRPNSL
jgi:hypothetical protein